jgi:hypothetical protein
MCERVTAARAVCPSPRLAVTHPVTHPDQGARPPRQDKACTTGLLRRRGPANSMCCWLASMCSWLASCWCPCEGRTGLQLLLASCWCPVKVVLASSCCWCSHVTVQAAWMPQRCRACVWGGLRKNQEGKGGVTRKLDAPTTGDSRGPYT